MESVFCAKRESTVVAVAGVLVEAEDGTGAYVEESQKERGSTVRFLRLGAKGEMDEVCDCGENPSGRKKRCEQRH